MGTVEIETVGPVEDFFWRYGPDMARVYMWIVYSIGLGLCIWAFRVTRFKRYLLIGLFFLGPFLAFLVQRVSYQFHKEKVDAYVAMKNQELREMREHGDPIVIFEKINIPLLETCLVLGLYFVIRNQRNNAQKSVQATTAKAATPDL